MPRQNVRRWARAFAYCLSECCGVVLVDQLCLGHVDKVRVAQVLAAIRVGQFHAFDQQVQVGGAVVAQRSEIVTLENIEHLDDVNAAGGRWRRRHDFIAPEGPAYRFAFQCAVVREIRRGNQTAAALHLLHDELCHFTFVEPGAASRRDALEGFGQIRLAKP